MLIWSSGLTHSVSTHGSRENKRIRLSPFSGSDGSGSEDDAASVHAPLYSNANSPQLSQSTPNPTSSTSQLNAEPSAPVQPKARKGRRKLGAIERKEVHELRKMGACTRCWGLKMKVIFYPFLTFCSIAQ